MLQNVAFHRGLHFLQRPNRFSENEIQFNVFVYGFYIKKGLTFSVKPVENDHSKMNAPLGAFCNNFDLH